MSGEEREKRGVDTLSEQPQTLEEHHLHLVGCLQKTWTQVAIEGSPHCSLDKLEAILDAVVVLNVVP